ncbi:thiaminase II [Pleomorphomonas diazotrophica]|uniref:Aminopyrimidine aminohydrolase n=1 Tax=Pleomorphomonas diazotrophica TaxID=1166257 RepID=A0A1I4QTH6_9HYPH|nr:thiaminase II [Pleomorphomonas diazotrophica]PKR90450.1 thiaminase II [Pleomorphomonas diazotrophica]SFM43006.1 thiaminase (transcriptional activator TenA) [Pleomorphomonas diazotrophica]
MSLYDRLIEASADDWRAYTEHPFVEMMAAGTLPETAFRHYLVQDYLFLIQFVRAYALAAYKGRTIEEMRYGLDGLRAILDGEMALHVNYCAGWGLTPSDLEAADEDMPTTAYTRFVLDWGVRGDLLDLHVALAPCIIGYAVIARRLASIPGALAASNPYAPWIAEYAGDGYQQLAASTVEHLDTLSDGAVGEVRFRQIAGIFAQASRLEAAFWQMGLDRA